MEIKRFYMGKTQICNGVGELISLKYVRSDQDVQATDE